MPHYNWDADSVSWGSANAPGLHKANGLRALVCADAVDTIFYLHIPQWPEGISGSPTLRVSCSAPVVTTGNIIIACDVWALANSEAAETESYAAVNNSSATAVAGTAGQRFEVTVTLSNIDSLVANEDATFRIRRDGDNASDTATGDVRIWGGRLEYTAA